jgi:hypothetical protein
MNVERNRQGVAMNALSPNYQPSSSKHLTIQRRPTAFTMQFNSERGHSSMFDL